MGLAGNSYGRRIGRNRRFQYNDYMSQMELAVLLSRVFERFDSYRRKSIRIRERLNELLGGVPDKWMLRPTLRHRYRGRTYLVSVGRQGLPLPETAVWDPKNSPDVIPFIEGDGMSWRIHALEQEELVGIVSCGISWLEVMAGNLLSERSDDTYPVIDTESAREIHLLCQAASSSAAYAKVYFDLGRSLFRRFISDENLFPVDPPISADIRKTLCIHLMSPHDVESGNSDPSTWHGGVVILLKKDRDFGSWKNWEISDYVSGVNFPEISRIS